MQSNPFPARRSILISSAIVLFGLLLGLLVATSAPALNAGISALRAPGIAREYLATHSIRKLQIGAGRVDYAGWLNTDIDPGPGETYLDLTKRFPDPDASLQYIFGEHVIEHLSYEDGLAMLRECYRVLAPGGTIRLATPNLLKYLQLFREPKTAEVENYLNAKLRWHQWPQTSHRELTILNFEMRSFGHQFVYDPGGLSERLEQAGFRRMTEFPPGESDDPQLRGIEARHNTLDLRMLNDYETMVIQAGKP